MRCPSSSPALRLRGVAVATTPSPSRPHLRTFAPSFTTHAMAAVAFAPAAPMRPRGGSLPPTALRAPHATAPSASLKALMRDTHVVLKYLGLQHLSSMYLAGIYYNIKTFACHIYVQNTGCRRKTLKRRSGSWGWTSLNLNRTRRTRSLRSGPRFTKFGEPDLKSGSEFEKIHERTGPNRTSASLQPQDVRHDEELGLKQQRVCRGLSQKTVG